MSTSGDSHGDSSGTAPEPDPEAVAAAALACEGVHALTRGADVVEIATYLPGRRVLGVRVAPGHAEVHIVTEYGANMVEVADRVRTAVRSAAAADSGPPPQVDVYVDDIQGPEGAEAAPVEQATSGVEAPGEVP